MSIFSMKIQPSGGIEHDLSRHFNSFLNTDHSQSLAKIQCHLTILIDIKKGNFPRKWYIQGLLN